ncbi:DUF1345 domain-containing protein [Naumannella halotolerans]|uniref:Putative membrane protein n=1 Tax=Naumannella halotolerans TaxID=993414 RepID=A0A4R7J6I7_9ACTN|nr:DUF1345 domain-containing protein [Naumannella halotolerans]TDT33012.1 putative membrane protein [Naumannella halotolerans]
MSPAAAGRTRVPPAERLRSENVRGYGAALVSSLTFVVIGTLLAVAVPAAARYVLVLGPFTVWILLTVAQVVMLLVAFRGLRGEELRLAAVQGRRSKPGGLLGPVTPALLAVIAVFLLIALPQIRVVTAMVPLALVLVICCWVNIMVHFALEYAEMDPAQVRFPEDRADRPFSDYVYLAFAVQSTFGTTDVEMRSPQVRKRVTTQGMIAFTYNTLIVTMIITLIIG